MVKRLLLPLLFVLLAAALLLTGARIPVFANNSLQESDLLKSQQRDLHQAFAISDSDVVFIGDDLTAMAPWHEAFPALTIRNRGLTGDTSAALLQRINSIIEARPHVIVVQLGANDAALKIASSETAANLRELLGLIESLSPKSKVILQSALPLLAEHMPAVEAINSELQRIAEQRGLPYIDLQAELFLANGELREGLGLSNRHLLGPAYQRWAQALAPYLEDIRLASAAGTR